MDKNLAAYRAAAEEMARQAGAILRSLAGKPHDIRLKGEIDLVTEADRASQDFLVREIGRRFPGHGILAEEGSGTTVPAGPVWVVDPLDGTTNFAHGFPFFCVSIGLVEDGRLLVGAIHDPLRDELFSAAAGAGATLDGRPLAVSATNDLGSALLATGFPYDIRRSPENNLDHFARFAVRARAIRRAGSAALDLCYTAAGRFDGYWELKLKPWDTAAGVLVVREAGGRVTSADGSPWSLAAPGLLASNGLLHEAMAAVLAGRD